MAAQLEVIKFRDIVSISSIPRLVPGFEEPTIEINGKDFRSVSKVLINSSPSPEFIIINKNTIYAQLPYTAAGIKTIEVISNRFTRNESDSRLEYEIGDKTQTVTGIQKLVQLFVKWILQSPGSDIFDVDRGGGLQEMVGQITSGRNMSPVLGAITRAITTTSAQIRTAQVNAKNLPLNERLLSADVQDLQINDQQMEARVRIKVRSVAGPEAVADLGL